MAKTKEFGRVVYIEPNDLTMNKQSNSIVQPYEDYSLSVNLAVTIMDRYACGHSNKSHEIFFSSDNGTISFFGGSGEAVGNGKQGYLTTNFTDISSNNVDRGNKECLGIESINIIYETWFFPVVTIKFIDVRGTSLFMPQEQAYYRSLSDKDYDYSHMEGGSFFKALFSFPYPLFKLSVKGFYGQEVTYNLAVMDFKSSFNSNTGNFECTVQFKGYMYGVYTDIPMTFLGVAPYMEREYWLNNQGGKFRFKDEKAKDGFSDKPILTFPEFREAVSTANKNADQQLSSSGEGEKHQNEVNKSEAIQKLIDSYNSTFNSAEHFNNKKILEDDGFVMYYAFKNNGNGGLEYEDKINEYIESVKAYDNTYGSNYAEILYPLETKSSKKWVADYQVVRGSVNGERVYNVYSPNASGSFGIKERTDCSDKLDEIVNKYENAANVIFSGNNNTTYLFSYKLVRDFLPYLVNERKDIDKNLVDMNRSLNVLKVQNVTSLLGFPVSIENVFRMGFAHMDTFITSFYKCLNNIENQLNEGENGSRSKKKLNMEGRCDVKQSVIPPFPLCFEEKTENGIRNKQAIFPDTEFTGGKELEEVKFVRKILEASQLYSDLQKEVDDRIANMSILTNGGVNPDGSAPTLNLNKLIPTTLYDYVNKDSSWNPYSHIDSLKNKTKDVGDYAILTFFLRAYYQFLINDDLRNNNKYKKFVGQMEACNFKKAVPECSDWLKESLLLKYSGITQNNDMGGIDKYSENDKVKNIITDENIAKIGAVITENGKYGKKGLWPNVVYDWINVVSDDKNYAVLPIGEFNPTQIANDIVSKNYKNSNKYLTLSEGDFEHISGSTTNTFFIYNDENYIKTVYEGIQNSNDEDISEIKDSIIKKADASNVIGDNIKDLYCYKTFFGYSNASSADTYDYFSKKGEEKNADRVMFDGTFYNYSWVDGSSVMSTFENLFNHKKIKTVGAGFPSSFKMEYNAYANDLESKYNPSLFAKEIYYSQNKISDEQHKNCAKAYLYLFAIPFKFNKTIECTKIGNGGTMNLALLREGAYYWRYDYMEANEDKDAIFTSGYCLAKKNEVYITNDTLNVSHTETGYKVWDGETVDGDRRQSLIKYFTDWANSDFIQIRDAYELKINGCFWNWEEIKRKYGNENNPAYKSMIAARENNRDIQKKVVKLCTERKSVISLVSTFDKNNKTKNASIDCLRYAFCEFIKKLLELYGLNKKEDEIPDSSTLSTALSSGIFEDRDTSLAIYLTLKDLYDKWFCGNDKNTWLLDDEDSDFNNVKYLDSYYNRIGGKLMVNADHVSEIISQALPTSESISITLQTEYKGLSFYEYLYEICSKNGMVFMSIPLMYGMDVKGENGIENVKKMFDAIPTFETVFKNRNKLCSTYICLYTYKPSQHLDIQDDKNLYDNPNDGWDFDLNYGDGNTNTSMPSSITDLNSGDIIPAFGVTFAKQNQSYFTNISLDMSNPQVTEAVIAATQQIASKGSNGVRESTLYGQDLYRIYSNYAYNCTVDMMGNSQIAPLMYFQLNNIPMWRGAYQIVKVEHNISAGKMNTSFMGYRVSKYKIPFAEGSVILAEDPTATMGKDEPMAEEQYKEGKIIVVEGGTTSGGTGYSDTPKVDWEKGSEFESEKPSVKTWLNCVTEMGKWYSKNVHSYQGTCKSPREGRKKYLCELFKGQNVSVMDDCSSFVTACLCYYAYKIGNKDWRKHLTWPHSTAGFVENGEASQFLRSLGFVYKKIDGSTMITKTNKQVQRGDIINCRTPEHGHVEILWKCDTAGSGWQSYSWGNVHEDPSSHICIETKAVGMPCWYYAINYEHCWRLSEDTPLS